jgi:hypothetical protein
MKNETHMYVLWWENVHKMLLKPVIVPKMLEDLDRKNRNNRQDDTGSTIIYKIWELAKILFRAKLHEVK